MRCIVHLFLTTFLIFAFSGCGGGVGGGEARPSARLRGIRFGELDRAALELEFDVEVNNPYSAELPLKDMTYSLRVKKKEIVSGSARPNTAIAPGSREKVSLPVRVHYGEILRKLKDIEPGSRIRYKADLVLVADAGGLGEVDVPVSRTGKVTLPYISGVTYKRILELKDFE